MPEPAQPSAPTSPEVLQAIRTLKDIAEAMCEYRQKHCSLANGEAEVTYAPSVAALGGERAHRDHDGKPLELVAPEIAQSCPAAPHEGYFFTLFRHDRYSYSAFAVPVAAVSGAFRYCFIDDTGIARMASFTAPLASLEDVIRDARMAWEIVTCRTTRLDDASAGDGSSSRQGG